MAAMDKTEFGKTTVFLSKKGEVYRIPALYYNEDEKKLYAIAEKRTTAQDSDAVALVMKIGTVNILSEAWTENEEVLMKKCSCGYRPMNPCLLFEKHTGTLFLFFVYVKNTESWQKKHHCNMARPCYIRKRTKDSQWSEFTDLTDQLPEIHCWSVLAVGPGHGLQTDNGTMIVPAYAYTGPKDKPPVPNSFFFCSDDKGKTWRISKMVKKVSLECEMVEVIDDNRKKVIYCNARNEGGLRVQATVGQNSSAELKQSPILVETGKGCQGSLVSFPAQPAAAHTNQVNKWLLFSHPTSKDERLNLGVYLNKTASRFDPLAWKQLGVINDGPSGYSDLAYIGDGWFACLVECGKECCTEQIACILFTYDELKPAMEE
uniref:exo-alpha-sialidase n=1 Tax=Cyprinodon variegatus TaxID=28743 RepID=A0A3Q2D238_CYPVA